MYTNALGKEKCSMNWAGWGPQESTKEILTLPLSFIGCKGCQKTRRAELIVNCEATVISNCTCPNLNSWLPHILLSNGFWIVIMISGNGIYQVDQVRETFQKFITKSY